MRAQTEGLVEIELFVVDGGSRDSTVTIAEQFGAAVLLNHQRDAQIGKAIGVRAARAPYLMLLDADNELSGERWLARTLEVLDQDRSLLGGDAPHLTHADDTLANRYCTVLHLEDPIARQIGLLGSVAKRQRRGDHQVLTIPLGRTAIFGANGFVWRRHVINGLQATINSFDEADLAERATAAGHRRIAVVDGGGVFHHHIRTLDEFVRKRRRNGKEYFERRGRTGRTWLDAVPRTRRLGAVLYACSVIGPAIEGFVSWWRSGERAWLLHPVMTTVTLLAYAYEYAAHRRLRVADDCVQSS